MPYGAIFGGFASMPCARRCAYIPVDVRRIRVLLLVGVDDLEAENPAVERKGRRHVEDLEQRRAAAQLNRHVSSLPTTPAVAAFAARRLSMSQLTTANV